MSSRHFTHLEVPQRSLEWKHARCGRITSSRAADMLSRGKKKAGGDYEEAAGRRNLRIQLALERLTGIPQERGFHSDAMQFGADTEALARYAYECATNQTIASTGFLVHNNLMAGTSLDGHIGDYEGLLEIKCPFPATHYEALETGKVPGNYIKQITHALWLTGAQWCDWISFEPSFPEKSRLKVVRVERDDAAIAEYEEEVKKFLAEVDERVEFLKGLEAA
jgi:predicted phage-related endonuclease